MKFRDYIEEGRKKKKFKIKIDSDAMDQKRGIRIPTPKTGGPMKDKKKYNRRQKHKKNIGEAQTNYGTILTVGIKPPTAYNPANKALLKKITAMIWDYLSDAEQRKKKIDYSLNDDSMDARSLYASLENGNLEDAYDMAKAFDLDLAKMVKKLKE